MPELKQSYITGRQNGVRLADNQHLRPQRHITRKTDEWRLDPFNFTGKYGADSQKVNAGQANVFISNSTPT